MAFTVELTIRGLCALVPSEPLRFEEPGQPGQPGQPDQSIDGMTVLVVDARQPRVIPNGDDPLEVCGHLPLLRYPQPEENKLSGFLILDGHRIEISGIGPGPERALKIEPSFGDWIPMELVVSGQEGLNPASARIDPKFLAPIPPKGIAGRLDLKAGTVSGRSMGVWDFLPPLAAQNSFKFASEVLVSIPINEDQATLRAIARDGSVVEQVLKPKHANAAGNRSVNLLLSNLCFEDDEHGRRPRIEGDFAVFYDLLTQYNGVLRVPRFLGGPNQRGGQGTVQGQAHSSPACTGTMINP